jgi:uncharacterized membrane protein
MAGIGFVLKRLAEKDDLGGILRAYLHATMASTGPWLFTVLALGGISLLFSDYFMVDELINFRIVVVYNFAFSLMLSSPIYMVITRYIADCIHHKNVTNTPTVLIYNIGMVYALTLPFAIFYYGYYTNFTVGMRLSSLANLFLVTPIWILGVFVTALKDYRAVTRAFGIGMLIAVVFDEVLKNKYGDSGMLTGFNIGLCWIVFSLVGKILAEYPYKLTEHTGVIKYFGKYWELAVGGFFYNIAIWVDKWLMWKYAPEAEILPSKMVYYPDYDSAMFLAYLTIVPAMAIFIFSIETNFFIKYQRFFGDILEHKPLSTIRKNHRDIVMTLIASARNFLIIQGTITMVCILTSAQTFHLLGVDYLQIGIFRLGTLGAFFHVLLLFELIILSYFDCRKITMLVQTIFLCSNTLFTLISIKTGFASYGYGYFASTVLTFVVTSFILFDYLQKLPYHSFVTTNSSV